MGKLAEYLSAFVDRDKTFRGATFENLTLHTSETIFRARDQINLSNADDMLVVIGVAARDHLRVALDRRAIPPLKESSYKSWLIFLSNMSVSGLSLFLNNSIDEMMERFQLENDSLFREHLVSFHTSVKRYIIDRQTVVVAAAEASEAAVPDAAAKMRFSVVDALKQYLRFTVMSDERYQGAGFSNLNVDRPKPIIDDSKEVPVVVKMLDSKAVADVATMALRNRLREHVKAQDISERDQEIFLNSLQNLDKLLPEDLIVRMMEAEPEDMIAQVSPLSTLSATALAALREFKMFLHKYGPPVAVYSAISRAANAVERSPHHAPGLALRSEAIVRLAGILGYPATASSKIPTLADVIGSLRAVGPDDMKMSYDRCLHLLQELSGYHFKTGGGTTGSVRCFLEVHPECFSRLPADAKASTKHTFDCYGREDSDNFRLGLTAIARFANLSIVGVVPVVAVAVDDAMPGEARDPGAVVRATAKRLRGTIEFQFPASRAVRLRALGFNTEHPCDAFFCILAEMARQYRRDVPHASSKPLGYDGFLAACNPATFDVVNVRAGMSAVTLDKDHRSWSPHWCVEFLRELKEQLNGVFGSADAAPQRLALPSGAARLALTAGPASPADFNPTTPFQILLAMVLAGYPQAWDTVLKHKLPEQEHPRYAIAAALALPSASADSLTTLNAAKLVLKSERLSYDDLRSAFQVVLSGRTESVQGILHCSIGVLVALASTVTKEALAEVQSTTQAREALDLLSQLTLLCACREFQRDTKDAVAVQSPFFMQMLTAAQVYLGLFALHSAYASARRKEKRCFGADDEGLLTEHLRRCVMQHFVSDLREGADISTAACEAVVLEQLALALQNLGDGEYSQRHFRALYLKAGEKEQMIAFGQYLFTLALQRKGCNLSSGARAIVTSFFAGSASSGTDMVAVKQQFAGRFVSVNPVMMNEWRRAMETMVFSDLPGSTGGSAAVVARPPRFGGCAPS